MDINKVEELHTQVADLLRNEQLLAAFDKIAKHYPHEQEIASERELIALAQQRAEA